MLSGYYSYRQRDTPRPLDRQMTNIKKVRAYMLSNVIYLVSVPQGVISISGVCNVSSMDRSPSTRFFYLLPVFGKDFNEWKRMSPVHKVNKNSKWKSKFLLVSSSWEPIIRSDADEFEKSLLSAEFDCMSLKLTSKNHYSILNAFTTGTKLTVLEIACNKFIRELS